MRCVLVPDAKENDMSKELEERLRALLRSEYHMNQGDGFDTLLRTGRQAADLIETQAATLSRYREALERIAKCETSMNGHIARQALEPNPTPAQ